MGFMYQNNMVQYTNATVCLNRQQKLGKVDLALTL